MHRARADVAEGEAERERLAAELHETRAGTGRNGRVGRDRTADRPASR